MSNPFAIFRKNQTYWMAALVLVAILAFVVAPAIDVVTRSFRGGGPDNRVLARWNGGRITHQEVESSLSNRVKLRNFLTNLAKKVFAEGGTPAVPGFVHFNNQIFSLGIDENLTTEGVCFSRILLTEAKKIGVEFDDTAADEFLKEFCNQKISDAEFNELLRSSGITLFEARELIKQDLTAMSVEMALSGSDSPSPSTLWQNFLKLNQTAKVEVFPVLVSSYVDKVTERPSEAQIQDLYDAGKDRASHPDLPDPGFVQLDQANVEYVESNYKNWVEKEKAAITEEEIKAEYDRQLAAGLLKVPVDYKAPAAAAPADAAPATETPTVEAPAVEAPAGTEPIKADAPKPEATAPAEPAPATPTEPAGTPTEPPATPTEPAPASPEPAQTPEPKPETPSEPTGDAPQNPDAQSSLLNGTAAVRLVSFAAQEEQPPAAEPAPATEAPAPADTPVAPENPPAAANAPAATVETPAPAAATTTTDEELPTAEPTAPQMRDMTLEEARERVLTSLADTRASQKSGEVLAKLQTTMREYYLANRQYETLRNADVSTREVKKPVRPDLKKFAQEYGLTHAETGMNDRIQLAVTQFGGSVILTGDQRSEIAANVVTLPQLEMFAPLNSHYMGTDAYYLYNFWKVDAKPAFVPPLSDIRLQVEDWWRRIEARKLTDDAAQAMVKKMSTGDDPWSGALSTTERSLVVTTDPFTWYSRLGGDLRLSPVPKLDRIGEEFMKAVFDTEIGKFGVVSNNPKTVYYVFRVLEKGPEIADLQQRFADDPVKQGPMQIANAQMRSSDAGWRSKVLDKLNVEFP